MQTHTPAGGQNEVTVAQKTADADADSRGRTQSLMTAKVNAQCDPNDKLTAVWLQEFVAIRQELAPGQEAGKVLKDAEKLLEALNSQGIFSVLHLESITMNGKLNDVIECAGYSEVISEYFDRIVAKKRRKTRFWSFIMSLAGDFQAMETVCVNYGVASALLLTMTFANFAEIGMDSWNHYRYLALTDEGCQNIAHSACNNETMMVKSPLAWRKYYCTATYRQIEEDPFLNLEGTPDECCLEAISCAMQMSWNMEFMFAFGNGGGSIALLLTVLYTSWLYIALHSTKANRDRFEEAKMLTMALRQEFFALHLLFLVGIALAFVGIIAVMTMKTTTRGLSWLVFVLSICGSIMAVYILIKCIYKVFKINQKVDAHRELSSRERAKESSRLSKATLSQKEQGL